MIIIVTCDFTDTGHIIKLLRAEWFEVISDKWYPLEEDLAQQIEEAHRTTAWRTKVKPVCVM